MKRRTSSKIEKNHHHQQDGDETDDTADISDGSSHSHNNNNNNNENENNNETMFSKALLNLSFQDRNQIEEEMHGVSCMAIVETTESIELSLYLFEIELELLEKEHKIAYQKALQMITTNTIDNNDPLAALSSSSSFILSNEMKLRFLRTELFDIRKSVIRYTRYLDLLYELYGEVALQRPIRIDDLNRTELSYLKSGQYQLLPYRDRSGRRILVDVTNSELLIHAPRKVFLKVALYINFACIGGSDITNNDKNNVESQCKGVVIVCLPNVCSNDSYNSKESKERIEANALIEQVVPIRIAAVHVCLPNVLKFKLLASVYGMISKASISRTKIHLGNPIEIRYQLQQYGIPSELIPKTDTGNIKSVNLKQWIKLRTHLELEEQIRMIKNNKFSQLGLQYCCLADNKNNNIIVECPSSNDVVFRRGKTMNTHSGNARFQNLIESHVYEHSIDLNTCLNRRKEIEIQLIQEVRRPEKKNGCGGGYSSGRFLTWDVKNQWWVVIISDDEIETKIHYAFRDFQKKMLRTQQQQQKVLTGVTNLNSLFVRQQDGQTKKRYKDNNSKNGCCSGGNGNINDNACNNNACGYFFSTDNDAMDPMHIFNNDGGTSR